MRAFLPGPAQGRIILLNGASSSGKSSLARALQSGIDTPFWHISIDHLRDSGVLPTARIRSGEFDWRSMRDAFFLGFERSLLACERCEILCRTDRDRAGDGGRHRRRGARKPRSRLRAWRCRAVPLGLAVP
jgi:hypothetical protein